MSLKSKSFRNILYAVLALAFSLASPAQNYLEPGQPQRRIALFDRQGQLVATVGEPGTYIQPNLSPDRKRIAIVRDRQVWVFDIASGKGRQLTTGESIKQAPVWSPDGRWIAYTALVGGGRRSLYSRRADGSGKEEPLYEDMPASKDLVDWSQDGDFWTLRFWRFFGEDTNPANRNNDLLAMPVAAVPSKPRPLVHSEADELGGRVSTNARFVAYRSNETGKDEIYVKPFNLPAEPLEHWKVSINGGMMARWRGDDRELYYLTEDGQFMAVPVSAGKAFKAGTPKPLFRVPPEFLPFLDKLPVGLLDISRDGNRFLLLLPVTH